MTTATAVTSGRLQRMLGELVRVRWNADERADQLAHLLARAYADRSALAAELEELSEQRFTEILERSRETSTHYKWHLSGGSTAPFAVWLHEYKSVRRRMGGYAETIHNHRYGLSSLVLRGGYRNVLFAVEYEDGAMTQVRQRDAQVLRPGAVYTLSADDFHRVEDLIDGTVTLVVQHPAVRDFSVSVAADGTGLVHHVPIESRFAHLRGLLAV